MKLHILNGPNLNRLGLREPHIYGATTFEMYFKELQEKYKKLYPELELSYSQSNHEGDLIDVIHSSEQNYQGIVLNAGAYTHTSVAIADAIKSVTTPVVEVHISNTFARESFRHHSYLSPNASGIIVGFGLKSYQLAIESFL